MKHDWRADIRSMKDKTDLEKDLMVRYWEEVIRQELEEDRDGR
jgi:hypothetical protein